MIHSIKDFSLLLKKRCWNNITSIYIQGCIDNYSYVLETDDRRTYRQLEVILSKNCSKHYKIHNHAFILFEEFSDALLIKMKYMEN